MITYLRPEGVEHFAAFKTPYYGLRVTTYQMPEGVEHMSFRTRSSLIASEYLSDAGRR